MQNDVEHVLSLIFELVKYRSRKCALSVSGTTKYMEPRNEYFSLLSLNSLNNKEESEFTSLDSLKSFKEDYRVFFSFSLNSLKNKEKFRVFFLGLVKYSRRKKNGKEFRSASLFAWQLSVF